MKTTKKHLYKLYRILGITALLFTLNSSMCSENDEEENTPKFKSAWLRKSFMFEAYAADGSNPYITEDGENKSKYPLGEIITHDKMISSERDAVFAFGEDGFIYTGGIDDSGLHFSNEQWSPYQWDGGKYIEGCKSAFFPLTQVLPYGCDDYDKEMEFVNEVLKHTSTELQVKLTMTYRNTGTQVITITNFVKVEVK